MNKLELYEQEADQFAMELLMPKKRFIEAVKFYKRIEEVAKYFNVDKSLVKIRYFDIFKRVL